MHPMIAKAVNLGGKKGRPWEHMMSRAWFAGICISSMLFVQGCATAPNPSAPSRAELGTVGIVSMGSPTLETLGAIGRQEESLRGAASGASGGAKVGAAAGLATSFACGPFLPVCAVFTVPIGLVGGGVVGGLGGAVVGAANALPAETVAELEAALTAALLNRDLSGELAERILVRARTEEAYGTVNLGTVEVTDNGDTAPDYTRFATDGVSTVLEIGIAQVALTREDRGEAPLSLLINATARLVRVSDREELWRDPQIRFISAPEALAHWTDPSGDPLRREIDSGLERLASLIHSRLFGPRTQEGNPARPMQVTVAPQSKSSAFSNASGTR
jgi:hypothetical protein